MNKIIDNFFNDINMGEFYIDYNYTGIEDVPNIFIENKPFLSKLNNLLIKASVLFNDKEYKKSYKLYDVIMTISYYFRFENFIEEDNFDRLLYFDLLQSFDITMYLEYIISSFIVGSYNKEEVFNKYIKYFINNNKIDVSIVSEVNLSLLKRFNILDLINDK